VAAKTAALSQPNWIKPEFGFVFLAFDVNMRRFVTIASIKEESIRPNSQHRWHAFIGNSMSPNEKKKSRNEKVHFGFFI